MKTHWIDKTLSYDGSQLRAHFAYENFNILGNSIVAFRGPCHVAFEQMLDLEDVLAKSPIRGDAMLHFIVEVFERDLFSGVILQRLFAALVQQYLIETTGKFILRSGDDLYFEERKLSISVAAKSPVSTLIHFAINIVNSGTPVPTVSLQELKNDAETLAKTVLEQFAREYESMVEATCKVRPVF